MTEAGEHNVCHTHAVATQNYGNFVEVTFYTSDYLLLKFWQNFCSAPTFSCIIIIIIIII